MINDRRWGYDGWMKMMMISIDGENLSLLLFGFILEYSHNGNSRSHHDVISHPSRQKRESADTKRTYGCCSPFFPPRARHPVPSKVLIAPLLQAGNWDETYFMRLAKRTTTSIYALM
jgi:hypothetical protein